MDEPVCPGHRDALKRIAEPGALLAEQTRKFEEAMCVGKRGSALSRKVPQPCRKSGDTHSMMHSTNGHRSPRFRSVSESRRPLLPAACSRCHSSLVEMGAADDQSARRSAGLCVDAHPAGLSSGKTVLFSPPFGMTRAGPVWNAGRFSPGHPPGGDQLQGVGAEPLSTTRRESEPNPLRARLRQSSPRMG
jgi:hypothetical protein